MKRISIDIETLSLAPNALVLSIGAVVFSPQTGLGETFYEVLNRYEQKNRRISIQTTEWWLDLVQESSLPGALFNDVMAPVALTLQRLRDFCGVEPFEIWARGPQMDIVVLDSLYPDFGMRPPWKYDMVRDQRTLCSFVPGSLPFQGTRHNALDDAKHQARGIIQAMAQLGLD